MRVERLLLFLIPIVLIGLLNFASAEILLSQPKVIYNLGDNLKTEADIKPSQYTSGFFELNLKCGEQSVNIHKEHLTLNPGEKKQISSSLNLAKSFLGEMAGECNLVSNFGDEIGESQSFVVSNKIDMALSIENISINAGDRVILKGSAIKQNGIEVNGFFEINIEGTDIKLTREVEKGVFETSFLFPANSKAGNYVLSARVYEKFQGEETNSGESKISLLIKKKPSKLEIAISKQSVIPGESLVFIPVIYDQANEEIGGEIAVKVYDSFDKISFQKIIKSQEEQVLKIDSNQNFGYWSIKAESLGLEAKRLFYVEELEKVSFDISNDTLIITNIGNTIYKKTIQISIGEIIEIKNINLDVGEQKKLRLTGSGKYNIRVSDGVNELVVSDVSLTGQVIGVKDIRDGISLVTRFPIVWLFLIAVFGLFILVLVKKVSKKKFYLHSPVIKKENMPERKAKVAKENLVVPNSGKVDRAEYALVLHGRKENSGVVVVKIRDLKQARKQAEITINNIVRTIIEGKGAVYETSDYLVGIFSSATTRTFENNIASLKVSDKINDILREHNRKMKHKIDYGIAVNSGDLILKKEPHILKFTTVGNTLNLPKKIADIAKEEVLLSEETQKRLMGQIRADKEVRHGVNVYHIKNIIDREKNKKFISDFLGRLNPGKKSNISYNTE